MNNKPLLVVEILRNFAVKKLIYKKMPGRFLEIGCGSGSFSVELGKVGFFGKGIDLSEEAIKWCENLAKYEAATTDRITFDCINLFDLQEEETYDYVFCFEVLEHIENDVEALTKIHDLLTSNGQVIFTVPAYTKKWCITDKLAGHLRRYEKAELLSKINKAGFSESKIVSYGIPFLNIWHFFKYEFPPTKGMYLKDILENLEGLNSKEKTEVSGAFVLKHKLHGSRLIKLIFNKFTLYPFCLLQLAFFKKDFGFCRHYLVIAKK